MVRCPVMADHPVIFIFPVKSDTHNASSVWIRCLVICQTTPNVFSKQKLHHCSLFSIHIGFTTGHWRQCLLVPGCSELAMLLKDWISQGGNGKTDCLQIEAKSIKFYFVQL